MICHARTGTFRHQVRRKWLLEDKTSLLIITHITHSYMYYASLRIITHYCVIMRNDCQEEKWSMWHCLLNLRYQRYGSICTISETQQLAQYLYQFSGKGR